MIDTTNRIPRESSIQKKNCGTKVFPILGIIIIAIIAYVVINNSKTNVDQKVEDQSAQSVASTEPNKKEAFADITNLVKKVEDQVKDIANVKKLDDKDIAAYLKEYNQAPESPNALDNLLKLSLGLGKLKRYKEACAMLNKLETEYKNIPDSIIKKVHDAKLQYCK